MNDKLSLREIAYWQIDPNNSKIDLPTIQRDFVWKPKQIEDLWDSILRGYPIGSFLMQEVGKKYDLLDGQQRATAIMLGFWNPYKTESVKSEWSARIEKLNPTIWIDADPQSIKVNVNRFSVRITTTSHPWGYQAIDNSKILSVADRRTALEIFKQRTKNKDRIYTEFDNRTIFPFDASIPIPLPLLIEADGNLGKLLESLKSVPINIETKQNRELFSNRKEYLELLSKKEKLKQLKELLDIVHQRIDSKSGTQVNYDLIESEVVNEKVPENQSEQEPTLFIRMNSSGTPLSGNDLIYSIYKSLYPESKGLIESIGASFAPAKLVVSLVARLAYSSINGFSYPIRMTVKQFQKQMENDTFQKELKLLVGNNKHSEFKKLFDEALNILQMRYGSKECMPDFLVKQFILRTPDAFLFLVTWLRQNKGIKDGLLKKRIVGKLYSLQWFEFNDYRELWKEVNKKDFFESSMASLTSLSMKKGIKAIIPPNLLREYFADKDTFENILAMEDWNYRFIPTKEIKKYYISKFPKLNEDDKKIEEEFHDFIMWIRETRNKSLISFAQREYLNKAFVDYNSMETLEDSSVPWDWDHIYPASWVSKKHVKTFSIRYWTWSIGNYRALSLEQNRSESNNISPSERLKDPDIRQKSFVHNTDDTLKNDYQYWIKLTQREDGNRKAAQNHLHAILTRMVNIYEKYWNDLGIDDLY